jgi:hypothetical protein
MMKHWRMARLENSKTDRNRVAIVKATTPIMKANGTTLLTSYYPRAKIVKITLAAMINPFPRMARSALVAPTLENLPPCLTKR